MALPGMLAISAKLQAQNQPPPSSQQQADNQIAAAIHRKLMDSAPLRSLDLGVWVHDNGVATLTGIVSHPELRQQLDTLVRSVPGVQSVDDQLTIGPAAMRENQQTPAPASSAPQDVGPENQGVPEDQGPGNQGPENPGPENQNPAGVAPGPPPPPPSNPYGPPPQPGEPGYSPQQYPPQEQDQGPPQEQYQRFSPQQYQGHGSRPTVTIPSGTPISVMLLQGIDSRHTQPGMAFRGVLVRDVVLMDGIVALPRGAYVDGVVIDARPPGHLKGHPQLALRLSNVDVGAVSYVLGSSVWASRGPGKGGQTTGNVVGSAAVGTVIGGMVGGGPTALLGAVLGGIGGAGISALSPGARLVVPPESVLMFHLTAPLIVQEPSIQEIRSLAGNVPVAANGYGPRPYGSRPGPYGPSPYGPSYGNGYPPPVPPSPPIPGAPPGGYPY